MQEEIDQNYAPVEVVQEEERLRKEREGANKEALQVRAKRLPTSHSLSIGRPTAGIKLQHGMDLQGNLSLRTCYAGHLCCGGRGCTL